jgi:LmbE family N-acetylglucosaminyl deacetylase
MEGLQGEVYAPSMSARPAVILSPHLDDAVLSCWHLLSGPGDVSVINVFAGSPPPGTVAWWDAESGASDPLVRMDERRAEDREAMAVAGRSATNLDFLDGQYEPGDQLDDVVARLRDLVDPGSIVYAPAALGEHTDHEQVRTAALALAASGQSVRLYADHPHAVRLGWPASINGFTSGSGPDVDELWHRRLADAGLDRPAREVHRLGAAEQERKLRAVSAYRTQIASLGATFGHVEGFPAFPYEIVWTLR